MTRHNKPIELDIKKPTELAECLKNKQHHIFH